MACRPRQGSTCIRAAYTCSLEEDLDGAPQTYGLDNPDPVNAQQNPATALQQGIISRQPKTPVDLTNPRKAYDFLPNAAAPYKNFEFARDHPNVAAKDRPPFEWAGLYPMTPTNARANQVSIDQRGFLEARGWIDNDGNVHFIPVGQEGTYPVIQPDRGRFGQSRSLIGAPGFYVSKTSTVTNISLDPWDQLRYLDATDIPYAAWAGWWSHYNVDLGDFGLALRPSTGASSGFVFGDGGTSKVGEVSSRLLRILAPGDGSNEPRDFTFLALPRTGHSIVCSLSDPGIQAKLKFWLGGRLSAIEGSELVMLFLSLGADLDKFQRFRADKLSKIDKVFADTRYLATMATFQTYYGYTSG